MLVVDASVIVKLVVAEAGTESARLATTARDDCIAPDVLMIEVASALAKKVRFAGLSLTDAIEGLRSVPLFLDGLIESAPLLNAAIDLSMRLNHSLFDCLYLALAIDHGCAMLTADRKFAATVVAGGYGSNIDLLR